MNIVYLYGMDSTFMRYYFLGKFSRNDIYKTAFLGVSINAVLISLLICVVGFFGDLTITPVIGWHDGNLHYNFALSIFMPTGEYDSAEISLAPPSVNNILNFSKNKWMFMPTLSATYLDPQAGLEFSGALGIGFSTRNPATDWKNAPELTFEGAIGL